MRIDQFSIQIEEAVLEDLRERIGRTRWPDQVPGIGWEQGTELGYLQDLLGYWRDGFDWRTQEERLNSYDHFRADVDGNLIHFVHHRAAQGPGIPLILTHGWPSSFVEYLTLVPLLTDPAAHGIDGPGFDVVIPSLPGYGFSQRPARTGVNYRDVARRWHLLMQGLGYQRYGAGGGDFGAGVAAFMALDDPEPMIGIHLSTLEIPPDRASDAPPPSEPERAYQAEIDRWDEFERGYSAIQSTRPQTLGYGLNDSPAGLAAWILEKWRTWGDTQGDLDARFSRDFLLTNVTIYWVTQSITSSVRDYFDNRMFSVAPGPADHIDVPTAFAVFDQHFTPEPAPPREWVERLYNIRRWTPMPRGGHFAGIEEPEMLARDIAAFFGSLQPS